jgi:hypothetical protein
MASFTKSSALSFFGILLVLSALVQTSSALPQFGRVHNNVLRSDESSSYSTDRSDSVMGAGDAVALAQAQAASSGSSITSAPATAATSSSNPTLAKSNGQTNGASLALPSGSTAWIASTALLAIVML